MVTYCNASCKKKHRSKHKKACDRRVAELHDEELFKEHPPTDDCPICFLPLPVNAGEMDDLDIHISILGTPEDMDFTSEDDLVKQIRPGIDGLILEKGFNKGTFLPSVWDSLTASNEFLNHLKLKAGLPANYWSDNIKIKRYTVEEF